MPFRRNRTRTPVEDLGGEFAGARGELPSLASQLSAEADHLATVYPPNPAALHERHTDTARRARPKFSRKRMAVPSVGRAAICASVIFAVALGSYTLFSPTAEQHGRSASLPQPPRNSSASPGTTGSGHEHAAVISPATFVRDLSDPELEAWLDLRRQGVQERIAF